MWRRLFQPRERDAKLMRNVATALRSVLLQHRSSHWASPLYWQLLLTWGLFCFRRQRVLISGWGGERTRRQGSKSLGLSTSPSGKPLTRNNPVNNWRMRVVRFTRDLGMVITPSLKSQNISQAKSTSSAHETNEVDIWYNVSNIVRVDPRSSGSVGWWSKLRKTSGFYPILNPRDSSNSKLLSMWHSTNLNPKRQNTTWRINLSEVNACHGTQYLKPP